MFNVTVVGGQMVDLGNVPLIGWYTRVTGHVFIDTNANGKLDPGEQGVPNFDVTIKNRTNDMYVSGQNLTTTDFKGTYHSTRATRRVRSSSRSSSTPDTRRPA